MLYPLKYLFIHLLVCLQFNYLGYITLDVVCEPFHRMVHYLRTGGPREFAGDEGQYDERGPDFMKKMFNQTEMNNAVLQRWASRLPMIWGCPRAG